MVTDKKRDSNRPVLYATKVWTYPHMNLAIAVTGLADLGDGFDDRIRRRWGIRDIEDLNSIAQGDLKEQFERIVEWSAEVFPGEDVGTATVYAFGFPHGSNEMVRYTYRSMKDFEPERCVEPEPRFTTKPPLKSHEFDVPLSREEAIALATQIRKEQGDGTEEGTVAIGGELYLTVLEPYRITSELLYRFPDYEEMWQAMLEGSAAHSR